MRGLDAVISPVWPCLVLISPAQDAGAAGRGAGGAGGAGGPGGLPGTGWAGGRPISSIRPSATSSTTTIVITRPTVG